MRPRRISLAAAAVVAIGLGTGAAIARPGEAGPPPPGADERRVQEARDLAAVLRISPAQEAAWRAYLEAEGPPGSPRPPPPPPQATMTTPQLLDQMAAREALRHQGFERRIAATRALYDALSPDQRATFDALMRLRLPPPPHGGPPSHPPF